MEFLEKITNPFIVNLKRPAHGGNIFEKFSNIMDDWKNIMDFSTNINPLGPSKEAIKAMQENLWQIPFYPESNSHILREEISNYFANKISPQSIIVCSGITELINLVVEVFIRPQNKVLIPIPTYEEYGWAVKKIGGRIKYFNLKAQENFGLNNIAESLTRDIKGIFICNPNNPTARLESVNFLSELTKIAYKKGILVFLDEAFIDYCDSKSSLVFKVSQYPNLIVFRSFTKFFALSGLRIGYGVANKKIIKLLMNAKLSWNVNCMAQTAALYSLRDTNYIQDTLNIINEERKFMLSSLNAINSVEVFSSDTGFIFFRIKPQIDPKIFEASLLKNKIMIRNCGSFQGLDNTYFRIGIKMRKANQKLLTCIKKICEE
ncbi:MAG: pyridoxal phosphate-dependent aminotransferase [Candidatus Helarchaeota archaeon]